MTNCTRDPRAAGPARVGRIAAIADQVARVTLLGHADAPPTTPNSILAADRLACLHRSFEAAFNQLMRRPSRPDRGTATSGGWPRAPPSSRGTAAAAANHAAPSSRAQLGGMASPDVMPPRRDFGRGGRAVRPSSEHQTRGGDGGFVHPRWHEEVEAQAGLGCRSRVCSRGPVTTRASVNRSRPPGRSSRAHSVSVPWRSGR